MLYQERETVEDKWYNVEGLKMHTSFIAAGSVKKSLPIIMLSGLAISSSYMIPCARKLAADTDIYCPNLPGFGRSSDPDSVLNVSELSNVLNGFMLKSKIERAVIVGHSFGCQIAAEFALQFPEKLERLILAAPTGDAGKKSALRYFGELLLDVPREPVSLIPIAIRDYFRAGFIRAWKTLKFALRDCFEDKLPYIQAKTLIICGARDPIVSKEWAEKVTKLLPEGKLINIEGAAHAVNYNSPDEFASAIRNFCFK